MVDHSRRHLLDGDKSRFIAAAKYHQGINKHIIESLKY
jgi:hypothetical protein